MARRRVFISYQRKDRMKAKGFNLLKHNKNVEIDFVGRHLLDPVNSENEQYIKSKIKEQLHGTSVTAVLIGSETCDSKWVQYEIEKSLEKDTPNGIVAIRLEDARLPDNCPIAKALSDAGAEIIDWNAHSFDQAIERAALTAGRVRAMRRAADADDVCARLSLS
jgi:hypothetical protein